MRISRTTARRLAKYLRLGERRAREHAVRVAEIVRDYRVEETG